jgi:signal transduction histidine kinase
MLKHKNWFLRLLAMIACLGLGHAGGNAAGLQPAWSSLMAVAEDSPDALPDVQWQRIASGEGIAVQRGSQIIVAPMGQAYWAGFSLSAAHLPASSYWLSLQSPTLDSAQLWWRSANGPWTAQAQLQHAQPMSFGSGQMFAVWQLTIPSQSSIDVLLRTQGVNRMQFPLVLQSPSEFLQQQQGLYLLMGAVLAVPWVVVFYVLTMMRSLFHPWLVFFLAMAVFETVGALWVSGLMSVLWPWLDRFQTARLGSMSYGVLMALSIHHARAFLRTPQYDPGWDKGLRFAAVCWWLALPLVALFYSSWMRSALLYLGTWHSLWMLALAWRTYRRHPRPYIAIYVWVWGVYLLSVAVYWLFRWFEWPLITTLGAQFVQGSVVATLLGWSACLQVLQHRQGMQMILRVNTERSRLYAAAQHDLWQPLQSMQLYARNLLGAKPAQQAHLLEGLQLASSYVDDFMHSLRHLAQDQAKPIDPSQFQSVLLGELLKDTLSEFEVLAAMRDVQLRTRLSPRCVWVHPLSLQRLVRNLLSNALRYGASGGKVLLGTRSQGELLWLWCIDRGEGMSQAQLQACFKAFNINGDAAPVPQSLGLGLFSVKQLALHMQTPVLVRSQQGQGVAIGIGLAVTPPRH